jgi:hypothetical protein
MTPRRRARASSNGGAAKLIGKIRLKPSRVVGGRPVGWADPTWMGQRQRHWTLAGTRRRQLIGRRQQPGKSAAGCRRDEGQVATATGHTVCAPVEQLAWVEHWLRSNGGPVRAQVSWRSKNGLGWNNGLGWKKWLLSTCGQLGRQGLNVRLVRRERSRFGERRVGIVEPTLGQRRPGRSDTPIHHALPDPLFERGMAFRREITLAGNHGGPVLQERFPLSRS